MDFGELWKERDGWMGLLLVVYTIKGAKKEGSEQERAKVGEVGLENLKKKKVIIGWGV